MAQRGKHVGTREKGHKTAGMWWKEPRWGWIPRKLLAKTGPQVETAAHAAGAKMRMPRQPQGISVLFAVGATVLAPAHLAAQVASADVGAVIVTGSAALKERTAVQAGLATGAEEAGWALLARP